MATVVKYFYGTEAQILSLTPDSQNWVELAFYYPSDRLYFYQIVEGEMKKRATGIGVNINGEIMGGIKNLIEENETLNIPENYEYNCYKLNLAGDSVCEGEINIM